MAASVAGCLLCTTSISCPQERADAFKIQVAYSAPVFIPASTLDPAAKCETLTDPICAADFAPLEVGGAEYLWDRRLLAHGLRQQLGLAGGAGEHPLCCIGCEPGSLPHHPLRRPPL